MCLILAIFYISGMETSSRNRTYIRLFHSFTFGIFTESTRDAQASVSDTAAEPAANGDKRRSPRSRASMAEASWRSTASKQGPRSLLRQTDFSDLERPARVAESSVVPARFQDCAHENET